MLENESTSGAPGAGVFPDVPALVRAAVAQVRDVTSIPPEALDEAVGMLVDRYVLSLTLGKPVGIATWAEHYVREFGRVGTLDVAAAVSRAIATAAAATEAGRSRAETTLPLLDAEVARYTVERRAAPANAEEKSAELLLSMLAARDSRAIAHARAVAHWARRLCAEMHLARESTDFIALCALLHDVGMIATPESIINKRGALTGVEMSIVRDHAAAGERILRGIPELERCADVLRSHHERWDGAGYPDGISGANIPFESRVVAVADGFHAMISERPHRLPIAPRVALDILADGRGTQWDPSVVDAMLAMFRHAQPETMPREQASKA
jgi:putative nucleotidyltransferase with HDIG domain